MSNDEPKPCVRVDKYIKGYKEIQDGGEMKETLVTEDGEYVLKENNKVKYYDDIFDMIIKNNDRRIGVFLICGTMSKLENRVFYNPEFYKIIGGVISKVKFEGTGFETVKIEKKYCDDAASTRMTFYKKIREYRFIIFSMTI